MIDVTVPVTAPLPALVPEPAPLPPLTNTGIEQPFVAGGTQSLPRTLPTLTIASPLTGSQPPMRFRFEPPVNIEKMRGTNTDACQFGAPSPNVPARKPLLPVVLAVK